MSKESKDDIESFHRLTKEEKGKQQEETASHLNSHIPSPTTTTTTITTTITTMTTTTSRQEASNGQWFPCPALLFFLIVYFLVISMEAGQRPR